MGLAMARLERGARGWRRGAAAGYAEKSSGFSQQSHPKLGLGFPIARLVALMSLRAGMLWGLIKAKGQGLVIQPAPLRLVSRPAIAG
jgi:hypothetical protein